MLLFPIQSATVTDDGAADLRKSLTTPLLITVVIKWGLIALGALLLIMTIMCFFSKTRSSKPRSLSTESIVNVSDKVGLKMLLFVAVCVSYCSSVEITFSIN